MIYPKDKCYFCGSGLYYHDDWGYICSNKLCYDQYKYSAMPSGRVDFQIESGELCYSFLMQPDGKMQINQPRLLFDQQVEITKENYLQQIDRIKNLQAFK